MPDVILRAPMVDALGHPFWSALIGLLVMTLVITVGVM
jgi:hypothetical protein